MRLSLLPCLVLCHCAAEPVKQSPQLIVQIVSAIERTPVVDSNGATLSTRFNPPEGFERKPVTPNSFAEYLRNLPLKPQGSRVKYFNGETKDEVVYDAVVDMDIGKKDLQQCADAIMRLRGEYFFAQKKYDSISFVLTNGFRVDYTEWMKGNRIVVDGNKTSWRKLTNPSNTYSDFRSYMELVFTYAGSLSLSKTLRPIKMKDMSIGDVFIVGGTPGHAVIVVDMAENKNGEKVFMVAQSFMPAQETHILKNLNEESMSPWYNLNIYDGLYSPQWIFGQDRLMTW